MKKNQLRAAVAAFALALTASPALAEGWAQSGDWLIRGRAIYIAPDESSSINPIGGKADFSNEFTPELDFTYFFTPNIAAELILGMARHSATVEGGAANGADVGSALVVPPTLTLQYHFTDFSWVKPYVGAGLNYTMYFDEEPGSQTSLDFDNSFGVALQAGADVPIDDHWSWNIDVKKIYTNADAKWNGGAISANIDLDPWVIGTGIGYRF